MDRDDGITYEKRFQIPLKALLERCPIVALKAYLMIMDEYYSLEIAHGFN